MGSLLGPIFVQNWLNKCPIEFETSLYRRYVDAIFVFLNHLNLLTRFANMSSEHQNINFTIEQENISSLSFLDIKIWRKNGTFVTSVY